MTACAGAARTASSAKAGAGAVRRATARIVRGMGSGAAFALLALAPTSAPAQSGALLDAYREGEALYAAGRYAEAEPPWREALARAERELGPEHPGTAGLLGNLAALYRQ